MKIHVIQAFDDIKAVRRERYPFHDRTGNIENYFNRWVREKFLQTPLEEADIIYAAIRFVDFFKIHIPGVIKPTKHALKFIYERLETPHFLANSERYFTVCQWSHGTCMNLHNCLKFQSTTYYDNEIPIPLCVDAHPINKTLKTLLANFVGNFATHPIRGRLAKILNNHPKIVIKNATADLKTFQCLMAQSWFALCPRGFGPASFRIYEALQLGCIPVIISDSYYYPYADEVDWKAFSVSVPEAHIKKIPEILTRIKPDQRRQMIEAGLVFFESYCTKPAVCRRIIAKANHLKRRKRMKCTIEIPAPGANVIKRELAYTVNEDAVSEIVSLKLTATEFVIHVNQADQLAFILTDISEAGYRSNPSILEFTVDTEAPRDPGDMTLISIEEESNA